MNRIIFLNIRAHIGSPVIFFPPLAYRLQSFRRSENKPDDAGLGPPKFQKIDPGLSYNILPSTSWETIDVKTFYIEGSNIGFYINFFYMFNPSRKVSYIPKYINIKKQSILKLLRKFSYKVTGVMNSVINTTKTSCYKVPCGQIIGWLLAI